MMGLKSTFLQSINESTREFLSNAVSFIPALLGGLILLFLTRYGAKLVRRLTKKVCDRVKIEPALNSLLVQLAGIGMWILGIAAASVVTFPGLRLGDVIAALGLGSVAIGFAFQDIFKNFLSGILLLFEGPFKVNDEILVNDYQGIVEQINIRTTQIRTFTGERVLIPNAAVYTNAVTIQTALPYRRTDLMVGVDYNTHLRGAKEILEKTLHRVQGVLSDPNVEVDLVNFNDSSIDLVVRYWTAPQTRAVRAVQTQAIIEIKQAFDKAQINIPYPIRTVYHYNQKNFSDDQPIVKVS
ncbi:MAG: mechanosensitive ion channel family protein [Cyanobacteria bacterium P01_H01_bin.15]